MNLATELLPMVRSCAADVYVGKRPTPEYADRVTRMLMGTAAQESGFQWRRQRNFPWGATGGAFSLWQVEYKSSVLPSLTKLISSPELLGRATDWLWQDPHADKSWINADTDTLLFSLRGWDRFGCLFARLHYLRVASAIPDTLEEQAAYWIATYNGGGVLKYRTRPVALAEYAANYTRLVQPAVDAAVA